MIDRFFAQTNDTIWAFLSETGRNKEVFSCYSYYEIDDYVLFFYAMPKEVVLMCLDIVDEGTVEFADRGVYSKKQLKYFRKVLADGTVSSDSKDFRLSPAVRLFDYACMMRRFFSVSGQFSLVPAIHLMLLTNSRIVNYPQVVKTWQQNLFGVSALQGLSGLRPGIIYDSCCEGNPFIPVNDDVSIAGSEYWTKWHKYLENRGWYDWNNPLFDDYPRVRRGLRAEG